MSLVEHAKRELALISNDEKFNNSIIKAVEAFSSYGHSGGSALVAIPILHDLLQFKNLTPLTDNPHEWTNVSASSGVPLWQNARNPQAFSEDKGETYYLLSDRDTHEGELPIYNSEKINNGY